MLWLTQQLHNYEDEIKRQRESLNALEDFNYQFNKLHSNNLTKYPNYHLVDFECSSGVQGQNLFAKMHV